MKYLYKNPIIIYNPIAAGGRAKKMFSRYYAKLKNHFLFENIDVYEAYSKNDTITKIEEIHNDNHNNDLIISIGGDGSISTICNGLMRVSIKERLPILPLPSGSGNSLLRDFNVLSINDSINNYINNNIKENLKMLDVLHVEEINGNFSWYCVNVCGLGFVSDIIRYGEKKFKKFGVFRYILGMILALKEFKSYKITIKYNNERNIFQSDNVFFMTLSNTKYTGGKIMIAPHAEYNDGFIDVVIIYDVNRIGFLNGFRKAFKGKHIKEKGCFCFKTDNLEIYSEPDFFLMPDGELEGKSPVKITVIPKQIKLIV